LGREQANCLAERLRAESFCGRIVAAREEACIQTARIVGDAVGAEVELSEAFCAPDPNREEEGSVLAGFRSLTEDFSKTSLLLVVGAEVCKALTALLELPVKGNTRPYNGSLTALDPLSWRVTPAVYDTEHLPYEKTTFYEHTRESLDLAFMASEYEGEISLPSFEEFRGERVLHIGDTESNTYPFYRKVIEEYKPRVIVHTGDFADEVKIGRHPEKKYEYVLKTRALIEMMRRSGARLVFVVGNHDSEEELRRLAPDAEVYSPGAEVTISGVPCRLGHRVRDMVFDRKYCLYGHGMAGEAWRYGMNVPGEPCRFNVAFGSFFLDLENDRFARIPRYYAWEK
jgi:hypothetical protein